MLAVEFSPEAMVVIGALVGGLATAIGLLFRLLMAAKDRQLADKDVQIKDTQVEKEAYRKIAENVVHDLERTISKVLTERGIAPVARLLPVVPEHSSPVTPEQSEAADFATLQARATAAALALKQIERFDGKGPKSVPAAVEEPGAVPPPADAVVAVVAAAAVKAVAEKLAEPPHSPGEGEP